MKTSLKQVITLLVFSLSIPAATITVIYGDNDGFGVGASIFKDPLVSNATLGDAPFTDVRLVGGTSSTGPFLPTSTLLFGPPVGTITSVLVTLRMAEFGGNQSPLSGPNSIVVDEVTVPDTFLNSFLSMATGGVGRNIDTRSFSLDSSFFSLFADGSINLTGTRISERSNFGSFQVDYLSFAVTTTDVSVPEPATMGLLGISLGSLGLVKRRQHSKRS